MIGHGRNRLDRHPLHHRDPDGPAGHQGAGGQKDTTNADLTIKATGIPVEVGLRLPQGRRRGHRLHLHAGPSHRVMSNAGGPKAGDNYLLKVDNPLVVPVGKKIRIITTANDVIHALHGASFGIKQDAIPGFVRDTWFRAEKTGDFYGQCQELCGKEHAYMPIHVKVLSAQDYSKWVEAKRRSWPPRRTTPPRSGRRPTWSQAWRKGLRRQLRGLPPGQRQGRRPDQASGRRCRRSGCRQGQADCGAAERSEQRRHAGLEAAERHRDRCRDHLHQEQLVQQDRPARAAADIKTARK
jgi:heme/copper-type cytochrome/quinol oxidase subunit 2